MKLKLSIVSMVGFVATSLIATAQPAAPAGDTNTPAAVAPAAVTPTPATSADTGSTSTPASATRDPNAVLPLITMEGVPLTDAIKNLARQASLNYMIDPKIPYLAPAADGHSQQPNVDLRLENVTAQQALTALLNNYSLTIVEDPKTKISRITVRDPAAPEPLVKKIIQLKYADPTNLLTQVQTMLVDKRSRVVPENRTSQLVVLATDKEMADVDELVARLDTKTPEVLIEARLIETSKNPTPTKGVDWTGTLQAQHFTFGNNVLGGEGGRYSQTLSQQPSLGFAGGTVVTNGIINTVTYGANNLIGSPGLLADTAKGFNPATAFLDADGVQAALSFL